MPADGDSTVDGGGGIDTLIVDWSTIGGNFTGYWYGYAEYSEIYGSNPYYVFAQNIEVLTVKFGSGTSDFYIDEAGIVAFDGGGGSDAFTADFSGSVANIGFTLNPTAGSTSTFINQGSTVKNVESVNITTGSGNDSLTGGALADTFSVGGGVNIVNGGGGSDGIYSAGTGRSGEEVGDKAVKC